MIVIDPGEIGIRKKLAREKFSKMSVLLTHCHIDHSAGVPELEKDLGAEVYLSKDEFDFFKMGGTLATFLNTDEIDIARPRLLGSRSGVLELYGERIEYFLFPGHTPGSLVYKAGEDLFCGDLLFKNSIGRTDLFGGDEYEMAKSLRGFAAKFGPECRIRPGHMSETDLETELKNNPVLKEYLHYDDLI